uniref:Cadherin-like protein n=1 Tax=Steinernema glaseri TaxID=37863 RepID=A0A1I7ZMK7_9BILA
MFATSVIILSLVLSHLLATLHATVHRQPLYLSGLDARCEAGCLVPDRVAVQWIAPSRSPCLHAGQTVFEWPKNSTSPCGTPEWFHSDDLSFDPQSGLTFAKHRVCFYSRIWEPHYLFKCKNGKAKASRLRVGHTIYSKRRRMKRWMRRRNPPSVIHFQQDRYVAEIPEDAAVKDFVLKVTAQHNGNQPLYYSMVAPEDTRSFNTFTLDTSSGEIWLAKPLDREALDVHVIKVTAYERLDPSVMASTTVVIDVLDVQDNMPMFERDSYFTEVREDAPIGTTVLSVFARDLDAGLNGEVEYSITDETGFFAINAKTGVLQTTKALDRENISMYRFQAIASDKGTPVMSSKALIEINLIDVNDNAPQFDQEHYNITILETVDIPSVIAKLSAQDQDIGDNGKVHYSIVASSTSAFSIDYRSGELSVLRKPDPRFSPIMLVMRAKDSAQPALSSTAMCSINIIDVNDHAPSFVASQRDVFIDEGVPVGSLCCSVLAVDEDTGKNGEVRYRFAQDPEDFKISAETGKIEVVRQLDRETKDRYVVQIIAEDGGEPSLSSSVNITIHVRDVNDNAPEFAESEYNVTFPEDSPVGTEIIRLRATDADADAKLVYRLETDDRDIFALIDLGNEGAVINLAKSFHSNDMVVHLVLVATDEGGLQGRCGINIFIDDVNRPPYFLENPLSVRIPENSPVDFHVAKIRAVDNDRGVNSDISYALDLDEFRIDNETGLITVARELDRERRSSYTILVSVSDKAEPPLSSTTILEVILEDENDNAPVFTSLNYTVSISEDIPVGTSFLQVTADDEDIGNNAIVDYYFEEEDEFVKMDLFRIDRSSGTIRVNSKLDRETTPRVVLPVLARDRGDPSLVGRSVVTISLADVNDNAPQFQFPLYNLWVAENSPIGTTVGQLVANDLDEGENARIAFRIFGGNDAKLFGIETDPTKNGVVNIVTRSEFDCEAKIRQFHIELQAISGQLSATVPVTVYVSDENDNKPQIRDFNIITVTFEGEVGRSEIATIPAFDPDINATLEYFIVENDIVNVDKQSGMLSYKYTLERSMNMPFKACVSDGPNTVCARARLMNIFMDEDDLRNSVTVKIDDTDVDDFLDLSTFDKFVEAVSIAANTNASSVHVFSIQEVHDAVNVSFFVYRANKPISSWKLEEIFIEQRRNISETIGREVQMVRDNMCVDEPCQHYQRCRQTLKYTRNHEHFSTDNFIMHGLRTTKTFYCECPRGFTSADATQGRCDRRLDLCFSSPCQNNGTCTALENDYKCDCSPEYTGKSCEQSLFVDTCLPDTCNSGSVCYLHNRRQECRLCPWGENDRDEHCNLRSVSFGGDGYIVLTKVPSRLEWTFELSVATISPNGVLAFAGSRDHDFIELYLSGGLPKLELSLGGDVYKWHTIRVNYFDHTVQLVVDDCDEHISLNLGVATGYRRCATQTILELPQRCKDLSLPCDRFLDLSSPMYIGGKLDRGTKSVVNGYSGCILDVKLDGIPLHFGDFDSLDKRGSVVAGCRQRRDFCSGSPCPEKSECVNKWDGFHCRCNNRIHSQTSCARLDAHMPSLLLKEASYAHFQPPPKLSYPFQLVFEFRTREKINQVMVLEFKIKSQIFIFSLESGLAVVQIDSERYLLPYPYLADGEWHGVTVDFQLDFVNVTLDYIYDRKLPVYGIAKLSQLDKMYSGVAPSTNHPAAFVGCLRNVEISNYPLKITTHAGVKPGCGVENQCQIADICPKRSTCVRKWDRHSCRCDAGFVGDTCTDFCALNGICANNGTCVRSSTEGKGYECACADSFRGGNCERKAPLRHCPQGWFGEWPDCTRCQCDERRGFSGRCDGATGECQCRPGSYLKDGLCTPCYCGYGSVGKSCNAAGQCRCAGEAKGTRCDRCADPTEHLDQKTLRCRKLTGRCPSNIEEGIQWPSTMFGMTSRQSCRKDEVGFASRKCSTQGVWEGAATENCSLAEVQALFELSTKEQESVQVARRLSNTTTFVRLTGKSVVTAATVLSNVVKSELAASIPRLGHVRDSKFVKHVVVSASHLMRKLPSVRFLQLAALLFDYGRKLALAHQRMPFLQPIAASTDNLMYIVDDVVSPTVELPIFSDKHRNQISLPGIHDDSPPVFYFFARSDHCVACGSFLVGAFGAPPPVRVVFSLGDRNSWSYQECAILSPSEQPKWTVADAKLIGLNDTHATCEFLVDGVYTVLSKPDQGVFLKLSSAYRIPYFAPASGIFSLFLCTVSFVTTVFKTSLDTKVSRLCVIMSFVLNATAMVFTTHVELNTVFCPVRNAVISFCSSTLFAWTFLYSWSVYKIISKTCHYHEKRSRIGIAFDLFVGLIVPIGLTISVFVLSDSCVLSPKDILFLLFVGPIAIFVLLSFYSSATSLMVALTDSHAPKAYISRSIFLQWFLMALFGAFNVLGLGMAFKSFHGPLLEVIVNVVLMFSAITIFLWSTYFTETINVQRSKHVELWVEDSAKPDLDESAYHCDSPLLQTSCQDVSLDSVDNPHHLMTQQHWMPDVIPPTPQETRSVPLAAAHILSSPQKALLLDSQHYALSSPTSTLRKNYESPYGTLEDNDVEDAYYTYSATRYKTPSSTFKR